MRVLYSWIKEFVNIEREPEDIAERLNFAGISVDSVERIRPTFKGVITAKIVEVKPHPNADKLSLALVDYGKGTVEVVCGARNIKPGQVVPYAPPGASLKNGEFVLEARKIRGVLSPGMLCSETELDLGDDSEGIFILSDELDRELPVGAPLEEVLPLDDYIFEFELPSNRPDCFSVMGIAREISALFDAELLNPSFELVEEEPCVGDVIQVKVEDYTLCPRYTAKAVIGLKNRKSPFWLRWRLKNSGIRPLSAVVDVTNYVMLETGQPLHAFDRRFIAEDTIVVRRAESKEKIVTLDGTERSLKEGMLLIADPIKPVAIAGVMGAESSEVRDDTEEVIIESAHFAPKSIMRTSRILGLMTEASTRFEKGVDPEGTVYAARRAAYLMQVLCGGRVLKGEVDVYEERLERRNIRLRHERIERVVGWKFSEEQVKRILLRLGFNVSSNGDNTYDVCVPSFRVDVEKEIDIVEEVVRIYGYDKIGSTLPENKTAGSYESELELLNRIREKALRLGFTQTISNPLLPLKAEKVFLFDEKDALNFVRVVNPLSADLALLTSRLSINTVFVVSNNVKRGIRDLRIFEIGKVFKRSTSALPAEKTVLSAAVAGAAVQKQWWGSHIPNDVFDLKGLIEAMVDFEEVFDFVVAESEPVFEGVRLNYLKPFESALIKVKGETAGFIGAVKEEVLSALDIDVPVFVLEILPEKVFSLLSRDKKYRPLPVYPAITYDFSFIVSEDVSFKEIRKTIESLELDHLESVSVFDVYRGRGVEKGKKSMAIRIVFRAADRTLREEEVRPAFERAMEEVRVKFDAEIRGVEVS